MKTINTVTCAVALAAQCLAQTPITPNQPANPPVSRPVPAPPAGNPDFSPPGQTDRPVTPGRPFEGNPPPGHSDQTVPGRPFNNDQQQNPGTGNQGAPGSTSGSRVVPGGTIPVMPPGSGTSTGGAGSAGAGSSGVPISSGSSSATAHSSAQGSPAPVQGHQTGTTAGTPVQVNPQLQASLSAFRTGSGTITTQHKLQFQQALLSSLPRTTRPPQELVVRFVDDVALYLPKAQLTVETERRLLTAIQTVLANPQQAEVQIVPVRSLLLEAGLTPVAAQTVACDLHLLGTSLAYEPAGDTRVISGTVSP